MIHAHIDNRRAIPWWAALGAPLVGIPLMVALLSLAAPAERAPADTPESVVTIEQVDAQSVDIPIDADALPPLIKTG